MPCLLENGRRRRRKVRVREPPDRDDAPPWTYIGMPIQRCPAFRAEVESNLATFLTIPLEELAVSFDRHLRVLKNCTAARQRSGSPLTGAAVAHVHQHRVTGGPDTQGSAVTLCDPFHLFLPL